MQDVVKSGGYSLALLTRSYGEEFTYSYVGTWLVWMNDMVNAKTKLNDSQLDYLTQSLMDKYQWKVVDLSFFFKRLVDGHYGKFFENISIDKVLEAAELFWDERLTMAGMYSKDEHEKVRLDNIHPDVAQKMFDGVGEEKVEHNRKGGGVGSRLKNRLSKNDMVVRDRKEYLEGMFKMILGTKTDELKKYLLKTDEDDDFDVELFEMVEQELERRGE